MYNTILRPFYDKHITLKTLSHHPTKVLFELFQSRGCQVFEITKEIDDEDESLIRCDGESLTVGYRPLLSRLSSSYCT
jgi:endoribonuclease Dicer